MSLESSPLANEWTDDFDTIRCFQEHEVIDEIKKLVVDQEFTRILAEISSALGAGGASIELSEITHALGQATSTRLFQEVERSLLEKLLRSHLDQVETSGLPENEPAEGCLFISNHRDIVFDPLLINRTLLKNGNEACHLAIGDNLLNSPTSKRLAHLNRCFTVLRSVKSPRAMVAAMRTQSSYIRHLRFTKGASIWIAQREGRSKDNSDQTNPALLKMLALSKPKSMNTGDYFRHLRIVPVSISYEWDPCDKQKALQLEAESEGNYQKTGLDDLASVYEGITGDKGKMHCAFDFEFSDHIAPEASFNELASAINQSIYHHYHFYPVNFAALHRLGEPELNEQSALLPFRSAEIEIKNASELLEKRVNHLSPQLQNRIIGFYAQPLINYLKGQGKSHEPT